MRFERTIDLTLSDEKSLFLFGPRQTGKSTLLKERFPKAKVYNLLMSDLFRRLAKSPSILREELLASTITGPVIIDEIQKIPELLDEVHYLIEEKGVRFILTGSSARKLKRGGANLLAGRALNLSLFPLVSKEIPDFDFDKIINFGALPAIYNSKIPKQELQSYVGTYLKEEVQAEGLVRNLEPFSEFLDIAGVMTTELVNYSGIASDLGVSSKTVKQYFQILEDTLIGKLLPPFSKTVKRKPVATPKFFYFDVGVANVLGQRSDISPGSELFGKCFEHFIYTEISAYLSYSWDSRKLTFWRSKNKQEVDFLIGDEIAIEVKGTKMVSNKHLKGLRALSEEVNLKHKIIVSLDESARLIDGDYLVLPYRKFLKNLWSGKY